MFFFDTCNAVAAREDRKLKYWRLGQTWIEFDVVTSQRQTQSASDCVMHKPYSRCRVWRCDVTTSNSIQDGGTLVVNILVFDPRVQLQHWMYQRKTLLFALIKVSTFICKREISGLSSPFFRLVWKKRIFYVFHWATHWILFCFSENISIPS